MKKRKMNGGLLPRLVRIEGKCDKILRRLPDRVQAKPMDELIMKMRDAASELQRRARSDIQDLSHEL